MPNSGSPSITALVPMRHQSLRVSGKNYRPFAGRLLYHCVIESLLACPYISQVVINTDSPTIMEDCRRCFPTVKLVERPEHLQADTIPMNDVLLHDVTQTESDFYLQTHSTNPLLTPATITRAIETFLAGYPVYDSLFSVTRLQTRLWDQLTRPVNHNAAILLRTQDLPPLFEENSCLYLFTGHILQSRRNRIGDRPLMFEMDPLEAWDIDEESDFKIAEILYNQRLQPPSEEK